MILWWEVIQCDPYPPKGKFCSRDIHMESRQSEGEQHVMIKANAVIFMSAKKPTLPTPWSCTCSLQNYETIHFCYVSHPICGSLLQHPSKQIQTLFLSIMLLIKMFWSIFEDIFFKKYLEMSVLCCTVIADAVFCFNFLQPYWYVSRTNIFIFLFTDIIQQPKWYVWHMVGTQ